MVSSIAGGPNARKLNPTLTGVAGDHRRRSSYRRPERAVTLRFLPISWSPAASMCLSAGTPSRISIAFADRAPTTGSAPSF
jgi:hypothetical protein